MRKLAHVVARWRVLAHVKGTALRATQTRAALPNDLCEVTPRRVPPGVRAIVVAVETLLVVPGKRVRKERERERERAKEKQGKDRSVRLKRKRKAA